MTHDPLRPIRLKWDDARPPRHDPRDARGTPRFIGRVVSGGAMPNSLDRVYLVTPVRISGDESEGASGSVVHDPSRMISVVIVGTNPPVVGDLVLAQSIGGRWIAELNGLPPSEVVCSPCNVPRVNLTLSWFNGLIGNSSTPLTFDGNNQWRSDCSNPIVFTLSCQSGVLAFSATYFLDGGCPDGPSQSCSSASAAPQALTLVQSLCDPFILTYAPTSATCPYLAARGYASFSVTR